jgi:predicted MFS family arabinose efflux permease
VTNRWLAWPSWRVTAIALGLAPTGFLAVGRNLVGWRSSIPVEWVASVLRLRFPVPGGFVSTRLSGDYWRFWAASAASNLGDGFRAVALPLLAVSLTRDPLLIAGVTALTSLPWLLIGPISGAVVDRVDRRRLLVVVQLCRGVVAALFAVTVATGTVTIWLLYLTAAVIAVGETLADPAAQAAVPRLARADQLETANGRLVSAHMVTEIVGAPIGGALFAIAAVAPFFIDATTYLAAALLVWLVRTDLSPVTPVRDETVTRLRHDVVEGLRYVFTHPMLRAIAAATALANFGAAAMWSIMVLFATDLLDISEFGFGVLLAVAAAGGLSGALTASRLAARFRRRQIMLTSIGVNAATSAAVGLARGPILAGTMLFLTAAAIAVNNVVSRSLRQAIPPARLLGRVITGVRVVGLGAAPLGALAGGLLARSAGLRAPFFMAAAAVAAAAYVIAAALTRSRIDDAIATNADLLFD